MYAKIPESVPLFHLLYDVSKTLGLNRRCETLHDGKFAASAKSYYKYSERFQENARKYQIFSQQNRHLF